MSYDNLTNGKPTSFESVVISGSLWLSVLSLNSENLGWAPRYPRGSSGFDINSHGQTHSKQASTKNKTLNRTR